MFQRDKFKTRLNVVGMLLASTLLSLSPAGAADSEPEKPDELRAADVLPETMRSGEHFKVKPRVHNDGYMNTYIVDSDYGQFTAYGDLALARLIHEIGALEQLEDFSKTEVFAKSAYDSATGDLKTIAHVAQHPVGTVKGLPGGIGRSLHKYSRTADHVLGGSDDKDKDENGESSELTDAAEDYALKWLGVTGAEGKWYRKLRVDPYTRNQVLRGKVKSIAHVDAAAHVGMKIVPIPSIPGANYLNRVDDAVWDMDPKTLREHDIKLLEEAGVDDKLIQRFMNNEYLSPSQQNLTLSTLAEMKGVEGLDVILRISAQADAVDVAEFNLANILLLAAYHHHRKPLTRINAGPVVPVALDEKNRLLIIVSADYAFWTEELAAAITKMAEEFDDIDVAGRELWLRGSASEQFEDELNRLGWKVRQQIRLTEEIKKQFTDAANS